MSFLLDMLITPAYATTAAAAPNAGQGFMSLLPMVVLLGVFMYFMIIRPQSKRAKDHKSLMGNLKKGDEVVTIGGVLGRIEKLSDDFITLTIAEGVNINVQKNAIANCLPKGTIKSI